MSYKVTITDNLIYLLNCALNGKKADIVRISKMNLAEVFSLTEFHKLSACVAFAIDNIGFDSESLKPWIQAKSTAIRKNILFNNEREQIYSYMERNAIQHISLKGIIMQTLYPKFGMREMCDNDILYDSTYQEEMHDFMLLQGYYAEIYKKGNHDEYLKPPFYNFEFHKSLFMSSENKKLYDYYYNIMYRLLPVKGKKYEFQLSDEDFYVYNIAHAYKHYSSGGTGLRILTDTYVFLKAKKDTLDIPYIESECKKIDIVDFEVMCRTISQKLFSPDSGNYILSEKEEEFLNFIIMSGAYGRQKLSVENSIKKLAEDGENTKSVKWKYYFKRIFVPLDFIKDVYPFYYRHKVLIPVLWITRIAKALTINRSRIKSELKSVDDTIANMEKEKNSR